MIRRNLENYRTSPSSSPQVRLLSGLLFLLSSFAVLSLVLSVSVSTTAQVPGRDSEEDYPELFREIDRHLERSYLDLTRIRPRYLVERALSALELSADEIYVDNPDEDEPYVAVHVSDKLHVFPVNDLGTRKESMSLLERVFRFLERNYQGEVPLVDLRYAAANGYLQGIDPHTLVFTPKSFEEFEVHIRGEIFGVGMLVGQTEDGRLQVKQVLKDTPAFRAGFKRGDLIVKINDESTINMTVMEAVQRIRGEQHTEVTLTVKRESTQEKGKLVTLPISVKRDRVTIKSVESKLVDGEGDREGAVGYVKVINFDQNTIEGEHGLKRNLERLKQANGGKELSSLILDLRGNTGGLLTQAVQMCDVFLKDGNIVITAQKGAELRVERANDDRSEPSYPIIVLADEQSASGAEIVIGALQKNNRALVLGTPTFGKGSVQQLQRLGNGAQLKITVSEYLLPDKLSIQETGVVPDVLARPVTLNESVVDLLPNESVWTEKDYEDHIVSPFKREEQPSFRFKYLAGPVEEEPADDSDDPSATERFITGDLRPETDPLVQMALKILRFSNKPYNPRQMLEEKKAEFDNLHKELLERIVARLAELSVDWTAGQGDGEKKSTAQDLKLEIEHEFVEEPSGDDEDPVPVNKLVVKARLTNQGTQTLYRIKGLSRSNYFLFEEREFLFGKLTPGQAVERTQKIRMPYFPRAQNDLFTIEVSGDDGDVIHSQSAEIGVAAKERPAFAYVPYLKDRQGRLITVLEPNTDSSLFLKIQNVGQGPAYKGAAILRNKTGREIFLDKGRIEYADLGPGQETEVEFQFKVRPGKDVDAYEFQLSIVDAYSGESLMQTLKIHPKGGKATPFPNGVRFEPPAIDLALLDPESSKAVLVTDRNELRLRSSITANEQTFSTWVTNLPLSARHRTPDKVFYDASDGDSKLNFATKIPLSEGTNVVTVVAKSANGLEKRRSLVVRKR